MTVTNEQLEHWRLAGADWTDGRGELGFIPAMTMVDEVGSPMLQVGQFGGLDVVERTPVIELKSVYGLSALRDIVTVAGSGTVTHPGIGLDSEFTLATTASGTDEAILDSAERARYQPGSAGEFGIGVRLGSATLTGNQKAEWGAFTDDDGFIFGLDATGFYVALRKGGVDDVIRQDDFNWDKFDGTGRSGLTLDLLKGNIFQVNFTWYGYGTIIFELVTTDEIGVQRKFKFHEYRPTIGTSTGDPNLPVRAKLSNNGTAATQTMYVAGRQYSIIGRFNPNRRVNGHFRGTLSAITTTFVPVMSFRRKAGFESISTVIEGFDAFVQDNMFWQLRLAGSLTGASYGTPADTTANETAMEVDTSATAITGGEIINPGGILAAATNQSGVVSSERALAIVIPALQPVTLCVRKFTGTAGVLDAAVLRWREEW